jgi:Mg2+/citrate symporter
VKINILSLQKSNIMTKKILVSTLAATIILFLWSGVTQMFPWGVPTAQAISAQSSKKTDSFQTPFCINPVG